MTDDRAQTITLSRVALRKIVFSQVVAYLVNVGRALGSVKAGILASQLVYWSNKSNDPDGLVFRTQDELEEDTGLSRKEQETARKHLRDSGLLKEQLRGHPCRMFYQIDQDAIVELVLAWTEKSSKAIGDVAQVVENEQCAQKGQTSMPETGKLRRDSIERETLTSFVSLCRAERDTTGDSEGGASFSLEDWLAMYNQFAEEVGWHRTKKILRNTPGEAIRREIKKHPSREFWQTVFDRCRQSSFLRGAEMADGKKCGSLTPYFFGRRVRIDEILDGKYDDSHYKFRTQSKEIMAARVGSDLHCNPDFDGMAVEELPRLCDHLHEVAEENRMTRPGIAEILDDTGTALMKLEGMPVGDLEAALTTEETSLLARVYTALPPTERGEIDAQVAALVATVPAGTRESAAKTFTHRIVRERVGLERLSVCRNLF